MRRHGFGTLLWLAAVTAAVVVLSIGAASAGAALRPAPGPGAGMISTGAVYVTSTTDSFWHLVDPATFASLGYTRNDIKWYGSLGLPGTVAPDTVVTPAYQAFVELIRPPVCLAGLMSTGTVYIAQSDSLWHPLTAAQFASAGYSWSWVVWYGSLPGTIALS